MVANWSTGAAGHSAFFLLISALVAIAEPSRIKALPADLARSVTRL
jgi:hypothetical protein